MKTVTLNFSQGKETKSLQVASLRHAQIEGNRDHKGTNGSFYLLGFWAAWSGELE